MFERIVEAMHGISKNCPYIKPGIFKVGLLRVKKHLVDLTLKVCGYRFVWTC